MIDRRSLVALGALLPFATPAAAQQVAREETWEERWQRGLREDWPGLRRYAEDNRKLLASGVNFGFRRTVPHIFGISAGFLAMLLSVGFGLGALLEAFPGLHLALKLGGGAYLLYLAWRIATAGSLGKNGQSPGRPMTLLEAAAFQAVNPKAWVLAITAMALYASPVSPFWSVMVISAVFTLVNLPSVSAWAAPASSAPSSSWFSRTNA